MRPAAAHAHAAAVAFHEHGQDQQREGERQQPERDVVHARERHVRRADHQRHQPVAEAADHRRHDHEEHHDQAVAGDEHIEGVRLREDLQAGLHQLGAHHHREEAADARPPRWRRSGTSCRCPCGWSNRHSAASRWGGARGRHGRDGRCHVDVARRHGVFPISPRRAVGVGVSSAANFFLASASQACVVGVAHHMHLDRHEGVAGAAQFRALAVIDAGAWWP